MKTDSPFDSILEENNYKRNLLEAILTSMTNEENPWIPTEREFILSELVNGTIEYIGGRSGKKDYQSRDYNSIYVVDMFKYLNSEIRIHSKIGLDPKVKQSLIGLCKTHLIRPFGAARPYHIIDLFDYFDTISQGNTNPVFSIPKELIVRVQKDILPSLSAAEIDNIEGIGKTMRKYVDTDIKHLREHYSW